MLAKVLVEATEDLRLVNEVLCVSTKLLVVESKGLSLESEDLLL